ncbi:MAG: galactitol-1-phosphate 5-dehydrogenase [Clostridia bacterium]|nr:galactitol-1-phosphate 5-dehydrogenase [Clostridia bacterium]
MKVSIEENGVVRVLQTKKPTRQSGEALVWIKACGICGSDVPRVFARKSYFYPIVLGHEFSGIVEESDNGALVGKRVSIFPILPCKTCEFCQKEQYANCVQYDYYGSRRDGGMQDWLCVKEENLIVLPDGVSYAAGAMVEPLAVCLHAVKKAKIQNGESVLIYGAGTIGMLCGMWARSFGASRVYFVDIDEKKIEMAESLGFERYSGQDVEAAIEASGAAVCLGGCLKNVRAFGRVVIVGNPSGDMRIEKADYTHILRKQLTVLGSWNSDYSTKSNDWEESLQAVADGAITPEKLITHTFKIAEGEKAFEVIKNREFYNKIMLVTE